MKSKPTLAGIAMMALGLTLSACGGSPSAALTQAPAAQSTVTPLPTLVVPTSQAASAPNLELGVSGSGEVKVAGEIWQARSFNDEPIEAGTPVEIFEVDGTTVVVYPKEP